MKFLNQMLHRLLLLRSAGVADAARWRKTTLVTDAYAVRKEVPGLEVNMPQGAFYLFPKCNSYLLYLHPDGLQEPFRFYAYQSVGARPRACLLVIGHLLRFGLQCHINNIST